MNIVHHFYQLREGGSIPLGLSVDNGRVSGEVSQLLPNLWSGERDIIQRCILHGSSEGPQRYSARDPVVTDPGSASTLH